MKISEVRLYQVIWGKVSSRVGKLAKEGGVPGQWLAYRCLRSYFRRPTTTPLLKLLFKVQNNSRKRNPEVEVQIEVKETSNHEKRKNLERR
jgi:hypothetical protein